MGFQTARKFNTPGILLSACIKTPDACDKFFEVATPPGGATLSAARNIARYPWHQSEKLFALFDEFYPIPAGKRWREVPFIPYLNFAPSAWTLSLVYAGGGLNSLGDMQGIIVTPSGDVWALDNGKNQIVYLPQADASRGRILGRTVDGNPVDGSLQIKAPFHLAIDLQDRIWITNSGSNTVTRFPASDTTSGLPTRRATPSPSCVARASRPARPASRPAIRFRRLAATSMACRSSRMSTSIPLSERFMK